jgi:hypothetical protein
LFVRRQWRRGLLGFELVIARFVVLRISLRIVIRALRGGSLLRIGLLSLLVWLLILLLILWLVRGRSASLTAGLLILLRALNALVLHSGS